MPDPVLSREDEIREVLINAIEVQLAALKAGASFWKEWMERTSAYVKTATETLSAIRSRDKDAGQVLLEVVDQGRESMRSMTELPRNAATRFLQALDELEAKRRTGSRKESRRAGPKPPRKRRARVKP